MTAVQRSSEALQALDGDLTRELIPGSGSVAALGEAPAGDLHKEWKTERPAGVRA